MNPNKNFKNNSGWILCPSKSFPGKFYYFNVLNGEAAWSLSDDENKKLRREEPIHKITDKSHCFPEPDTPPIESPDTSSSNVYQTTRKPDFTYRKVPVSYAPPQIPSFGQASFPKYYPNFEPYVPNIIWTPIPYPNSMYLPEARTPMLNQITQTADDFEKDVATQPCNMPLCKRFVNYEKPVISFDKENKIVNKSIFDRNIHFKQFTPVKSNQEQIETSHISNSKSFQFLVPDIPTAKFGQYTAQDVQKAKSFQNKTTHIPNSKPFQFQKTNQLNSTAFQFQGSNVPNSNPFEFQKRVTQTNSNCFQFEDSDISNCKPLLQQPSTPFKFQSPDIPNSKPFQFQVSDNSNSKTLLREPMLKFSSNNSINSNSSDKISTVNPYNKVAKNKTDNTTATEEEKVQKKDLGRLQTNDLRFLLVAKRKQMSQNVKEITEKKKTNCQANKIPVPPKKKVSFDFSNLPENDTEIFDPVTSGSHIQLDSDDEESPSNMHTQPELEHRSDKWYLVVDTEGLLEEYEFINEFIQSDEKCSLLVPYTVRSEIEAVAVGNYRGRPQVLAARRLSRQFTMLPPYYTLQPVNPTNDVTDTFTNILNCCLEEMQDNYRVVLITNDPGLGTKAKSLNIECHNLEELKNNNILNKPKVSFPEIDKVLDLKKIKIIVNCNAEETPFLGHNEPNPVVNSFKQQLFPNYRQDLDSPNPGVNSFKQQLFPNYRQDLDCDKLINITKQKFNYESYYQKDTEEIGNNIQKLVLENKKTKDVVPYSKNNRNNVIKKIVIEKDEAANKDALTHYPNNKRNNGYPVQKTNANFNFQKSTNDEEFFALRQMKKNCVPISNVNDTFGLPMIDFQRNENNFDNGFKDQENDRNLLNDVVTGNQVPTISVYFDTDSNAKFKDQKIPPSFQKRKDSKQKVVFKRNNQPSTFKKQIVCVDDNLKRFYVKNKNIDDRIRKRIDEWICCYTQVMEDLLNHILQKKINGMDGNLSPPWSIQEALQYIGIVYGEDKTLNSVVHKLSELFRNCTTAKGKLKTNIKSIDFMKILGCGILLVQALKTIYPDDEELATSEVLLNSLLQSIENQCETDIDLELLSPVVCRSEIEHKKEERQNFIKDTAYIIDYLKKYYKEWETYEPTLDEQCKPNCPDLKVVRTFGKNLNMLKIDNKKSISLLKPDTKQKQDGPIVNKLFDKNPSLKEKNVNAKIAEPKLNNPVKNTDSQMIRHQSARFERNSTENKPPQNVQKIHNELKNLKTFESMNTNGNTFGTDENAGPKVIRQITAIDKYEKLLKEPLDLDFLDYEDVSENTAKDDFGNISCDSNNATDVSITRIKRNEASGQLAESLDKSLIPPNIEDMNVNCDVLAPKNDDKNDSSDKKISFDDIFVTDNHLAYANGETNAVFSIDSTNDSGFENDSTHAHSVVKIFFTELSQSFKVVHGFIDRFVKEIRSNIRDDRILAIHDQATTSLEQMRHITLKLKSIIQRESNEDTARRNLLIKAGLEAAVDKRMTRYRQVVTKCLEQANILENALKIIVSISDGNYDAMSIKSESVSSSIRYFNIFE